MLFGFLGSIKPYKSFSSAVTIFYTVFCKISN